MSKRATQKMLWKSFVVGPHCLQFLPVDPECYTSGIVHTRNFRFGQSEFIVHNM